eukprot:CAMPEP_0175870416 /NCGR_PEP_ID=MMETSP0107_2-20121207/36546_1 /TAXON_ID=195067 ORGANISM="Goniomonas pacifica, Strain CCMP1869" /NCGR_SAMPLE_ID=MMETSP0107_2 /ASSEMBLY_ACC=CAM_ASM_000203 /LENGTH=39 /DNA_ID= /DNA_START= /DNA_END= /DNA_ORIENTATION=
MARTALRADKTLHASPTQSPPRSRLCRAERQTLDPRGDD